MKATPLSLGALALAVAGLAGCGGSKCADGSCSESSTSFQLAACSSDADCDAGMACLPEKCDGNCAPDADGTCQPCPADGGGLCMPTTTETGSDPTAADCFAGRLGDPNACQAARDWGRMAVDTCGAQGSWLVDLHALPACPDGRPSGVAFTCCSWGGDAAGTGSDGDTKPPAPAPGVPPDTDPAACVTLPFPADPNVDPKQMAMRLCQDQGMQLQGLEAVDPDASGAPGTWVVTCCGPQGQPVDPPVADACVPVPVKVDATNPDPAASDPKMAADLQCRAMGLALADLQPGPVDPATGVALWTATCCGPAAQPTDPVPPPSPPDACILIPAGDGTCDAAMDLKQMAWDKCQEAGGTLQDLAIRSTCPDGTVGAVIATCCGVPDANGGV